VREAPVPSYRVRSAANEGSSTRMFAMAGGLAAVVGVGVLIGWGVTRLTTERTIPTIQADSRPVKIRPDDRGGMRVANQDEIIFERRGTASYDPSGRLAPAAEAPNLDALRAATAPPPATPAPRIVTETQPLPSTEVPPVPAVPGQGAQPQAAHGQPLAPTGTPPARPQAPPPPAPQLAQPAAPAAPAPVAAAPQAPATPAPRAVAGGTVSVQLGALDSEAGARTEWDRLARRAPELLNGRSPQILRFERADKPTMWRLRTGGFSAEAAREFCDGIRAKGGACAVIGG
jgi:hypothetical protein